MYLSLCPLIFALAPIATLTLIALGWLSVSRGHAMARQHQAARRPARKIANPRERIWLICFNLHLVEEAGTSRA
jgi:hypothetical protein